MNLNLRLKMLKPQAEFTRTQLSKNNYVIFYAILNLSDCQKFLVMTWKGQIQKTTSDILSAVEVGV